MFNGGAVRLWRVNFPHGCDNCKVKVCAKIIYLRRGSMKRDSLIPLLIITLFLPVCANAFYKVIDLGILPRGEESEAFSINNKGQIVGISARPEPEPFLLWTAVLFDSTGNGNNIDLGELPGYSESAAFSINNGGRIVGSVSKRGGTSLATLFDRTGGGTNVGLGSLGGKSSSACSINDDGQIVGYAQDKSGYERPTLFDPSGSGSNVDLGTPGKGHACASSINNSGQSVGWWFDTSAKYHGILFDSTGNGNNIELGNIGGRESIAVSINNNGQIVGRATDKSGFWHATLFDPTGNGNNIDLGTLGGYESYACSINDSGQIVGWAENGLDESRATLFDPIGAGNNIDLNTLIDPACGWILLEARSINNYGWIVGQGINPNREWRAYLLIPEPTSLLLLGLGLLGLKKHKN